MTLLIANILIVLCSILSLIFGLLYVTRAKFMRYHSMALEQKWEELNPKFQTVILALMRSVGGGLLSVAVTILILQYQFNKLPQKWIALSIFICGIIMTTGILSAHYLVFKKTKGRPPVIAALLVLILLTVGYILNSEVLKQ